MSRVIYADALKKNIAKWLQGGDPQETVLVELDDIGVSVIMEIDEQPTIEAVPLSEIYRCIAGHSDYHGDSILSAMTCIAEGKEVKPIIPIKAAPVVHGEWEICEEPNSFDTYGNPITYARCKHCGFRWSNKYHTKYYFKHCPNCGTDMRKGGTE